MKVRLEFEVEIPDAIRETVGEAAAELAKLATETGERHSREVAVREGVVAVVTVTP